MNHRGEPSVEASGKSVPDREPPFVADAGPLIALARVEKLHLLRSLFGDGLIPPAVHQEVQSGSGRPGATRIGEALSAGWLRVTPLADDAQAANLVRIVDAGEAEAIALCLERKARFLLIDDAKGRKVAQRAGLPLVGVAGVLLAAKSQGLLVTVSPVLKELAGVGYRLSRQLIDGVRRKANE